MNVTGKALLAPLFALALLVPTVSVHATGMATCDSGPQEDWQAPEALQERLEAEGWQVRRVKVDGGCYEVYALDADGERVEAYFHPVTLEPVPVEDEED